jgi:beta-glucosidase/6-phospho-beta-glucosidase/beta-galactosidase
MLLSEKNLPKNLTTIMTEEIQFQVDLREVTDLGVKINKIKIQWHKLFQNGKNRYKNRIGLKRRK